MEIIIMVLDLLRFIVWPIGMLVALVVIMKT